MFSPTCPELTGRKILDHSKIQLLWRYVTHAACYTCGLLHRGPCYIWAMLHMQPVTHVALLHTWPCYTRSPVIHVACYTCSLLHVQPITHVACYTCGPVTPPGRWAGELLGAGPPPSPQLRFLAAFLLTEIGSRLFKTKTKKLGKIY